jgi:hypothetical protein
VLCAQCELVVRRAHCGGGCCYGSCDRHPCARQRLCPAE